MAKQFGHTVKSLQWFNKIALRSFVKSGWPQHLAHGYHLFLIKVYNPTKPAHFMDDFLNLLTSHKRITEAILDSCLKIF